MLLEGKRLLITGVLTKGSIAYSVAERAQQEGAEVVLTGFGRTRRMTERAAKRLQRAAPPLKKTCDRLKEKWRKSLHGFRLPSKPVMHV